MPGKKYRSIKRPKAYEKLKSMGMSKSQAARISNAGTTHAKRSAMAKKGAKKRRRR